MIGFLPLAILASTMLYLLVRHFRQRRRQKVIASLKVRARQNIDRAVRGDWMLGL